MGSTGLSKRRALVEVSKGSDLCHLKHFSTAISSFSDNSLSCILLIFLVLFS